LGNARRRVHVKRHRDCAAVGKEQLDGVARNDRVAGSGPEHGVAEQSLANEVKGGHQPIVRFRGNDAAIYNRRIGGKRDELHGRAEALWHCIGVDFHHYPVVGINRNLHVGADGFAGNARRRVHVKRQRNLALVGKVQFGGVAGNGSLRWGGLEYGVAEQALADDIKGGGQQLPIQGCRMVAPPPNWRWMPRLGR
jgi:hypothetical protein